MESSRRKLLLGVAFWVAAAAALAAAVHGLDPATRARLAHVGRETRRALFAPAPTYTVLFPGGTQLVRGNGVLALVGGRLVRVGEVIRVRAEGERFADLRATIALDESQGEFRPRSGTVGVRRSQGRSFLFAVQTLVPEARWRQIQDEWRRFRVRHDAALRRELEPVAGELLHGALRAVAAELPDAFARHRGELAALAKRMREGLGREQVQPLLTEELWPIVVLHLGPVVESVGRELWERAPLMSFALRAVADRVLEDEPVRVEERWHRFVEEEALPALRARQLELEAAFGTAVKDAIASDDVQARSLAVWEAIRGDPKVQELARRLARELFLENARLEAWLRAVPDEPALQERFARLSERLQEFLDPLGDMLLLDESRQGINAELAYLIRLLLLRRDAQVIHLEGGDGEVLEPGREIEGRHEP